MTGTPLTENSLADRVASRVALGWSRDWARLDGGVASREAVDEARALYDLVGEVDFPAAGECEPDPKAIDAASFLTGFGDGFAIRSIDWPSGLPDGSLPDRKTAELQLHHLNVARWCAERGYPIASSPPVDEHESSEEEALLIVPISQFDLEGLRARERTTWSEFETVNRFAAERFRLWSVVYRSLGAMPFDAGLEPAQALLREMEFEIVSQLAYCRRAGQAWRRDGAKAEAVVAIDLIGAVMRSLFLLGTAADICDLAQLHPMPASYLDECEQELDLDRWMISSGVS